MIVYGDGRRPALVTDLCRSLAARIEALDAPGLVGLQRHAGLIGAFIAASELVQALADEGFAARGCDARSPDEARGMRLLTLLARGVDRSWRSGFRDAGRMPAEAAGLLADLAAPRVVWVAEAEGYRHYALYPETYLLAARRSGLGRDTRVIGLRSIGLGLAALVAAALEAAPPISLRPTGDPFRRRIDASPELSAEVRAAPGAAAFAVVDEGPGLSGSSFAAVRHWLEACGVAPARIHLFPSHAGPPGPEASPAARAAWDSSPRHHVAFETVLLDGAAPAQRLGTWVAELVGPLDAPLQDISGGAWRKLGETPGTDWPPADPRLERRKFLARAGGRAWLVKFVGLGDDGARKLATARRLAAAGLTPEPAGLRHGFLVERWTEGRPLPSSALPRAQLLRGLGAYLGFRARLPAPEAGAGLPELLAMARQNTAEALGAAAARRLDVRLAGAEGLAARVVRVDTDNRLHAWEWLVAADGRLLKTDALDHSTAHDLIGAQDIAWDVAGAAVEHDLDPNETAALCREVGARSGRAVDAALLDVCLDCYLAFQLGLWTFAAANAGADEAARLQAAADRYARALRARLDEGKSTASTRGQA